jgi:hypothetical protein
VMLVEAQRTSLCLSPSMELHRTLQDNVYGAQMWLPATSEHLPARKASSSVLKGGTHA